MLVNDIDIFAAEEHICKTEHNILHHQIAAVGYLVAMNLMQQNKWHCNELTKAHIYYSGYIESNLQPLIQIFHELLMTPDGYLKILLTILYNNYYI
ncbi:hypothetical protein BC936DRAFT_145126 [Jimgerdemannia flammicorona]|uniref:Uncharacterized protein n=1 Tax=Jimgerdemannia flammicorona TaxID=994334 RepID=A0A433DAW0_9FUNG|nr:hypothetical protein BC936DRAFT_145126 [Jimgerdemannia flammicorona]